MKPFLGTRLKRGQTASTSIFIRDNKRNVEWLLKQTHSTCFNTDERGVVQHRCSIDHSRILGIGLELACNGG